MKLNVSKNASYLGLIIILIAFGFLYFSYFFVYIPRQETQLQQRAFRILKEYGNNMFDKNDYYKNHFENYKLYYKIRFNLDSLKIREKSVPKTDSIQFADIQNVVNSLYDYVDCYKKNDEKIDSPFVFSTQKNKLFVNYSVLLTNNIEEDLIESVGKYYEPNPQFKKPKSVQTKLSLADVLQDSIMYKVPIDTFMSGLKFDRLFENIILFDDSRVYYNSKRELVTDITRPNILRDSVEKFQGGMWTKLNIRGIEKQIMVLPIDYFGNRFYLAGLITETEYKAKTRTIDNQLLILIAVLLLLVLIGMPILKIIFIGKNERLKSTDASASLISSILGTGLIILMIIGFLKHQLVDHPKTEKRIEQISDRLYQNVNSDIDSIKNLYEAIKIENKLNHLSAFSNQSKSTPFSKHAEDLLKKEKKFQLYSSTFLKGMFPINEIILMNKKGEIWKAVTRTPFSELVPIDLSQRQYFINASDSSKSWPTKKGLKIYIESIKSYNTGAGETAISFHNPDWDTVPAIAITSAIPSFYKQVLPKDVEFLIINSNGKVLYHSIKSKNLHENFLNECNFDPRLKNAMDFRTEGILHIDYNEKSWLARIVPLENTPLFHVTLIDLSQNMNKNARIFLFTFYFLMLTIFIIGMGMLILKWIDPEIQNEQQHRWFLNWILFEKEKYLTYKKLIWILFLIISFQLLGIWVTNKPTAVLLYHIIFISYSAFVSLVLLKREEMIFKKLLQKEYFPENIILAIIAVLVFVYTINFGSILKLILPLGGLIVLTGFLPEILQQNKNAAKNKTIDNDKIRRIYLRYIFLWLISLSAIPVVQFYVSIKNQENQIWQQEQFFTVAQRNLEFHDDYKKYGNVDWIKRIQGNGIDHLQVEFLNLKNNILPEIEPDKHNLSDEIYARLPDPITKSFEKSILVNDSNFNREWVKNGILYYTKGGNYGAVSVSSVPEKFRLSNTIHVKAISNLNGGILDKMLSFPFLLIKGLANWNILFYLIIAIIVVVLWILLRYVANVILNLNMEKPEFVDTDWIKTLFKKSSAKRFLLQSFHPDYYLRETKIYVKKHPPTSVIIVKASQLADSSYNFQKYFTISDSIFWINELDQFVYEVENHDLFLSRLSDLNNHFNGDIVIELPFDPDFIDEIIDEYIKEHELDKDKKLQFLTLKKRWKPIFIRYAKFNGYKLPEKTVSKKAKTDDFVFDENSIYYYFVWNNLTNYEKIVLFDLADDGLVNIKNNEMIKQLVCKGLIVIEPYPKLKSESFRKFIIDNLDPKSIKEIESNLGFKGKWKNTRYLILLILIPLAAFILISQGISIEKIFAIFAGVTTVITGALRLFDSNVFKSAG